MVEAVERLTARVRRPAGCVIKLISGAPAWLLAHPWLSGLIVTLGLAGLTSLILLNPNGRQVRDLWRNR